MLRVPARNYSKVSNTRSGLPGLRVKSPNTSTYVYLDLYTAFSMSRKKTRQIGEFHFLIR